MIPTFNDFTGKYLRLAAVPLVLISAILTSSLIRNANDITLTEIIAGLGAIAFSIVWGMMRDGLGYWTYSLYNLRVYESRELTAANQQDALRWWVKLRYHPLWASLVTLLIVIVLSCLIWLCGPDWRYKLIGVAGVIILPALMLFQLGSSIKCHLRVAMDIYSEPERYQLRHRRLTGLMGEDLLLSLLINVALVLPIARKPAFSLEAGYADPAFIIAFMVLMSIVLLFMLFFASRSRRYVIFGELLNGTLDITSASFTPWRFTRRPARLRRGTIWLVGVLIWSMAICLMFSHWQITPHFTVLYLCALLPLLLIYCVERYQTLYTGFTEAQEMLERYKLYVISLNKKNTRSDT